jgi:hypothetical protein
MSQVRPTYVPRRWGTCTTTLSPKQASEQRDGADFEVARRNSLLMERVTLERLRLSTQRVAAALTFYCELKRRALLASSQATELIE